MGLQLRDEQHVHNKGGTGHCAKGWIKTTNQSSYIKITQASLKKYILSEWGLNYQHTTRHFMHKIFDTLVFLHEVI